MGRRWRRNGREEAMNKQLQQEQQPTFFKVLVGDFTFNLRVPPAFTKHFRRKLPVEVRLRSCYVDPPISWEVETEMEDDSNCCITAGWSDVVADVGLNYGDFLLFKLVSEETLEFVAYSPTCCEKMICIGSNRRSKDGGSAVKEDETEEDEDEEEEWIQITDSDSDQEQKPAARPDLACPSSSRKQHCKYYPSFVKTLVKTDTRYLTLPIGFAREAQQWSKRSALLTGPRGRTWLAMIAFRSTGYDRLDLSTGWRDFIRDNSLLVGDTVRFECCGGRDNVISARVLSRAAETVHQHTAIGR